MFLSDIQSIYLNARVSLRFVPRVIPAGVLNLGGIVHALF